jgi:protocatechuate 3,4-dioxygenase beta subunit
VVDSPALELEPGHTVSGVVLDEETHQPVAGATVRLSMSGRHRPRVVSEPVISDAQGAFQVSQLAAGRYSFKAVAPGYVEGSGYDVRVPSQAPLRILLESHSLLMGQVIDDATEAPVAGAEVWLHQYGYVFNENDPAITDAEGRFSLHVGQGSYHLTAKAGARAGAYPEKIKVERSSQRDGLLIRLGSTGSLSGRISARSGQQPLESTYVMILHVASGWVSQLNPGEDGLFRVEHLPPGEYEVSAEARGFALLKRGGLHLKAGQDLIVDLALIREATLEGTVSDALGQPVPHVYIAVKPLGADSAAPERSSPSSDKEGHYKLAHLLPGRYQFQARTYEGGPTSEARELTLAEGEHARADFTLSGASGHVEGSVRRASGEAPAHDVQITASSDDITWSTRYTTKEAARFNFTLKPGVYVLTAEYAEVNEPGPEQRVTVEAGKTAQVVLTVPDDVVETSGTVLTSRGTPAPKASITLVKDALETTQHADERGHFTLKTPGRTAGAVVTLTAELGPENTTLENVRVGSNNLVLRLRQAASLRGRVSARAGAPVNGFVLTVSRENGSTTLFEARSFVGDTFTLSALPAGELELLARTSDGRSGKARVRLEPGGAQELELLVGGLGRVLGRLVDASGAPDSGSVYLTEADGTERSVSTDGTGRFELFALEPGPHVLEFDMPSSGSEEPLKLPFTLRPGETLDLGDLGPKSAVAQPVP